MPSGGDKASAVYAVQACARYCDQSLIDQSSIYVQIPAVALDARTAAGP
jgi:hypothetical protein